MGGKKKRDIRKKKVTGWATSKKSELLAESAESGGHLVHGTQRRPGTWGENAVSWKQRRGGPQSAREKHDATTGRVGQKEYASKTSQKRKIVKKTNGGGVLGQQSPWGEKALGQEGF